MIYICDPCGITRDRLSGWQDHILTEKHKKNMDDSTHKCKKCGSCFIINKESSEDKKRFNDHSKMYLK